MKHKRSKAVLLALTLCLTVGCATREIVLANYYPSSELTKGLPRLAESEVKVILDQTDKVGLVSGVAGYYLIPESELIPLLEASKEVISLRKQLQELKTK